MPDVNRGAISVFGGHRIALALELLLLIPIIGILLALLMPVVNVARKAERRFGILSLLRAGPSATNPVITQRNLTLGGCVHKTREARLLTRIFLTGSQGSVEF